MIEEIRASLLQAENAGFAERLAASVTGKINQSLTGEILLLTNDDAHFRGGAMPVVRNFPVTEFSLTEPLLGFYGMSQYIPSSIYPILKDFPPFLQDFEYVFQREESREAYTDLPGAVTTTTCLTPLGDLVLTMESYNSFDQAEKELETVDLPWVHFESFETVVPSANHTITLLARTIRGKPDFVFIVLEHDLKNKSGRTKLHNPVITGIRMDILGQELKCVSALDENALYHLTRRNSHIHADNLDNYTSIGAVFLTKSDCGNFEQFQLEGTDLFDVNVTVTRYLYNHPKHVTDEGNGSLTMGLDIRMKVFFMYTDYSLTGKQHEAKFWFK